MAERSKIQYILSKFKPRTTSTPFHPSSTVTTTKDYTKFTNTILKSIEKDVAEQGDVCNRRMYKGRSLTNDLKKKLMNYRKMTVSNSINVDYECEIEGFRISRHQQEREVSVDVELEEKEERIRRELEDWDKNIFKMENFNFNFTNSVDEVFHDYNNPQFVNYDNQFEQSTSSMGPTTEEEEENSSFLDMDTFDFSDVRIKCS